MRLEIDGLDVWYGPRHVLNELSLSVAAGFVVVTGRNGVGKSTLLKAIFGLVPISSGRITVGGRPVLGVEPRKLRASGIVYMPQGGLVFHNLSCYDNLIASMPTDYAISDLSQRIDQLCNYFPIIRDKLRQKAGSLSGGERQQLSFCMALMPRPKLLLLDEPLAGLSEKAANEFVEICRILQGKEGLGVLVVEQRSHILHDLATDLVDITNGSASLTLAF